MALVEPIRSSVYTHLAELLGTEEAAAVMAQFPTYDIADVVTATTLDLRLRETESRLDAKFADVRAGFADVRAEFADVRAEMREGFADVRTEIAGGRADLIDRMAVMQRSMITAFVSTLIAFAGLMLAAGIFTR